MSRRLSHRLKQISLWLVDREVWWIGFFMALGMFATNALAVVLALGVFFWLIRRTTYGKCTVRTPLDLALIPLLATVSVTMWVTPLPSQTWSQVLRLLAGIVLYYTLVNWAKTKQRLQHFSIGIVLVGILLALSAPVGVKWFTHKLFFLPNTLYTLMPLLIPDPIHPNVMAGNLVIILPLMVTMPLFCWRSIRSLHRIGYLLAFAFTVLILMLTQSRGAWLAFGISMILVVLLRWRWGWITAMVLVIFGGMMFVHFGIDRILDVLMFGETMGGFRDRMEIWSRALYIIQDFPLTGIGMGSFMKVTDEVYPFFYIGPQKIDHAHNLFLQIAVDLGILGLIAWMAAASLVILTAWRVYQRGIVIGDGFMAGVAAGLLGSQAALLTHGCLDAVTWGMVRSAILVWVIWALASASLNVQEDAYLDPNLPHS